MAVFGLAKLSLVCLCLLLAGFILNVEAFQQHSIRAVTKAIHFPTVPVPAFSRRSAVSESNNDNNSEESAIDIDEDEPVDLEFLKAELTAYLAKRKELDADTAAKGQVGKIVGGTKGNPILEYVSGSPNKAIVIEEAPNVFDYDELDQYGYGSLVKIIMKAGGRNAMYDLLNMERPPPPKRLKPKSAPKLVIDKTGETDQARYTGLKMGQVLDDDAMAEALERARQKSKSGTPLRARIAEEDYIQPFADKRNVGPKIINPDWTPERLDEYGKARGRSEAWARKAKMGEYMSDPLETLDLPLVFRLYAVLSAFFVAFSFGRATPNLLSQLDMSTDIMGLLQAPALAVIVASLGSCIVNAVVLAPSKNRNSVVWAVKGLLAGPVAVTQLQGLEDLITRGEEEELQKVIRNQQRQQ